MILEWHGLVQKNTEWKRLSPSAEFWKSLFARLDAAPSIIAHFQLIIEKISDKHKRLSVAKPEYNTVGTAKGQGSKGKPRYLEQTGNTLNAGQHLSPTENFTFFQYLDCSVFNLYTIQNLFRIKGIHNVIKHEAHEPFIY